MGKCILPAMLMSFLVGCVTNPVADFYVDTMAGISPEVVSTIFEPSVVEPQIFTTSDYMTDLLRLGEEGYLVVGGANFQWSGAPSEKQLSEKAKEVGADVVLYNSAYSHTESGVRPQLGVVPGTSSTTTTSGYATGYGSATYSGSAYGSGGYAYGSGSATASGYGTYTGTSTTTTDPQLYTYYVPYTANVYSYQVAFMRKSKPSILGVRAVPIEGELRNTLQRNTGAVVGIVLKGSPAFYANLLPGDVIIGLGQYAIATPADLNTVTEDLAGQNAKVTFIRNLQQFEVMLKLNEKPS